MGIKNLLKKAYLLTIGSSAVCFLLGLLVFVEADLAITAIAVILGLTLILIGLTIIVKYFADGAMRYFFGYSLLYALLDLVAGIVMMINPSVMSVIIALFVAVNLLIEFITKIQIGLIFKKYDVDGWLFQFMLALILLICSIIIIANPVEGTLAITKVVAGIIMVASVLNIVDCLVIREKAKGLKKSLKDIFD